MNLRKITSLSSFGAALEYYDFVIFASMAAYLGEHFFPSDVALTALLNSFAIFAMGYLARPFGGTVFGIAGDRFGRQKTFVLSMAIMASSTFLIGCLPTYTQIGIAAPLLLVILRLFQGISFGAELPGAITFLSEHAGDKSASVIAWMIFGVSLGALASSAMVTLLNALFTESFMHAFGWRIPFWLGGMLGICSYWLRRHSTETPYFKRENTHQMNRDVLQELLSQHWRQLLIGIGATLFGGSLIILYLYLPGYMQQQQATVPVKIGSLFTLGFIWSALMIPCCGQLVQRYGVWMCYATAAITMVLAATPMWHSFLNPSLNKLLLSVIVYQSLTAMLAVSYCTILTQLFPTRVRFTGIALCYNIAFALAGFTPVLAMTVLT